MAAWRGVALLAAAHFLAHADRALPSAVAPILKARFALSDTSLGLLLGPAFGLAFVAGSLVAGGWADRAPRWRLIGWGLLAWTGASAATAAATAYEGLLGARAAMALGQAVLAPAALSLLLQDAAEGDAGRRIAAFTSGASMGRSSALLLAGALLAALPLLGFGSVQEGPAWRWLFVISAAPNFVLAAMLLTRREPPVAPHRPAGGALTLRAWARGQEPLLAGSLIVAAGCIVLAQALGQWAPSLFNRTGGLDPASASVVAGAVVLAAAPLGAGAGGWLVDAVRRRGRSAPSIVSVLLLAVPAAAIGLTTARDLPSLTIAFAVATAGISAAATAALAGWQAITPQSVRGRASALYFACVTAAGLGLGPPLVGLASDLAARGEASLAFGLAGVTTAVALPAAGLSGAIARAWSRAASAVIRLEDERRSAAR